MDLMGLNQGNTIISYLNNKDLSCLDLIEFFSSDINVDNISDNELFKQYIYINLLNNSENEKFSQNKLKINELFEQKIDELIDKNIDIKDKYLNYLLINEEDEEKQMEIQLAIENKDYLIIPEELLEIKTDNIPMLLKVLKDYPAFHNAYAFGDCAHAVVPKGLQIENIEKYLAEKNCKNIAIKKIEATIEDSFILLLSNN